MSYSSTQASSNNYGPTATATFTYPVQPPIPPGPSYAYPSSAIPQLPYAGAAPPIPSYININPASWQAGYWQPNPYYKPQGSLSVSQTQSQTQTAYQWAPGLAWHQQRQQQQAQAQASQQQAQANAWNHYKRPKQPSKEYLQNELLKNPLGLEFNPPPVPFVRPEQYAQDIQSTPWVWAPRPLDEDDASPPPQQQQQQGPTVPARNASEPPPSRPHGSHNSPTTTHPNQHNQGNTASASTSSAQRSQSEPPTQEAFTSRQNLHTTFSPRIVRTPDRNRNRNRNHSVDFSTRASSVDNLTSQMGRLSTGTGTAHRSSSSDSWSRPQQPPQTISGVYAYSEEPSSMLSPLRMAETPNPDSQPLGSHLASTTGQSQPLGRHSSAPLIGQQQQRHSAPAQQPLGRHGSAPVVGQPQPSLGTIPETREPSRTNYSNIYSSMPRRKSSKSKHKSPPSSSSSTRPSPQQDSGYNSRDSGYSSSSSSFHIRGIIPGPPQGEVIPELDPAYAHMTAHISPTTSSSRPYPIASASASSSQNPFLHPAPRSDPFPISNNPLPPPPRDIHIQYSPARRHTPPPTSGPRIRVGFWNRRGDHMTSTAHIVYAPADKAYPPELAGYPEPGVGYRDENGAFMAYNETRPELPQSLPSRGAPPERPYESFVRYLRNSQKLNH